MLIYAVSTYVDETLKTVEKKEIIKKLPQVSYLKHVMQTVKQVSDSPAHYNFGHYSLYMNETVTGPASMTSPDSPSPSSPPRGSLPVIPVTRDTTDNPDLPGLQQRPPWDTPKKASLLGDGLSLNFCVQIGENLYPSTIIAHKVRDGVYLLSSWTKNTRAKKPAPLAGVLGKQMQAAVEGLEFYPYQALLSTDKPYAEKSEEEIKECLAALPLENVTITTMHTHALLLKPQITSLTSPKTSDGEKRQSSSKNVLQYMVNAVEHYLDLAGHPFTRDVTVYPNSEINKHICCYDCMSCNKIGPPRSYHVLKTSRGVIGHEITDQHGKKGR
jgi:hypothetical protein